MSSQSDRCIMRVADILVHKLDNDFQNVDLCCDIDSKELNEDNVCLIFMPSKKIH